MNSSVMILEKVIDAKTTTEIVYEPWGMKCISTIYKSKIERVIKRRS